MFSAQKHEGSEQSQHTLFPLHNEGYNYREAQSVCIGGSIRQEDPFSLALSLLTLLFADNSGRSAPNFTAALEFLCRRCLGAIILLEGGLCGLSSTSI